MKYKLGPKTEKKFGGWYRDVIFDDGRVFQVGLSKGRYARGMYGVKGWHWNGWVYDRQTRKRLLDVREPKSIGARGLLIDAGLIDEPAPKRSGEGITQTTKGESMNTVHYRFVPRYTAGSPGNFYGADAAETLTRLAADESRAYASYVEGVYGEAARDAALRVGLDGVAESRLEKHGHWHVRDEISDERFHVAFVDMAAHEKRQNERTREVRDSERS